MELIPPQDTSFRHGLKKYRPQRKDLPFILLSFCTPILLSALLTTIGCLIAGKWDNFINGFCFIFVMFGAGPLIGSVYGILLDENLKNTDFFSGNVAWFGIGAWYAAALLYNWFQINFFVCLIAIFVIYDFIIEKQSSRQDAYEYIRLCERKYKITIYSDDAKNIEIAKSLIMTAIENKNTPEP